MLDLKKIKLPSAVLVEGNFFNIKTDFRDWLGFAEIVNNEKSRLDDLDYLYLDDIPEDKFKGFEALSKFFNPPRELPRKISASAGDKILDYNLDADLIYSAFYEIYHIDLLETDGRGHAIQIHWHKFLALFEGLHGTKLNEIMGYRSFNKNDKTPYEKQMEQLKQQWKLPTKESEADKKARESFNALFLKK